MGRMRRKSTWELLRALAVLRLCALPFFARNSLWLLQWSGRLGGLRGLLKPTLFAQFVGGETREELQACMRSVGGAGIRPMLAATMEEDLGHKGSEAVYDGNCHRILGAISMSVPPEPLLQLKLSGLIPARLLVELGHSYSASDSRLRVIEEMAEGLTGNTSKNSNKQVWCLLPEQMRSPDLDRATGRLRDIGRAAMSRGVSVLVDAEHTYLNQGLSVLSLAAAAVFNRSFPVIWNTYQCYLRDAREKVLEELRILEEELGVHAGLKVVRGAYLLQERRRARRLQLPDPLCDTYAATGDNFDAIIDLLLKNTLQVGSRCRFMIASHNEESIRLATHRMEELGVDASLVSFAQLYGMCDQLTGTLADRGLSVYKSIPYGRLEEVLPYLARRAQENTSLTQATRKERALLATELRRRIFHSR